MSAGVLLVTALTLKIGELSQPVVTSYELGAMLFALCRSQTYKGRKLIRRHNGPLDRREYDSVVQGLIRRGVLVESPLIRSSDVFGILGRIDPPVETVACAVDPFAYISHMSAMEWHGITDRMPKMLFVSTPPPAQWTKFAKKKMERDLPGDELWLYRNGKLPELRRIQFDKIGKTTLSRYSSLHLGAFTNIQGSVLRVATIGRTFLDMIRQPDLCGGIYHVIEVYVEHAERHLQLIVNEVERHGTKIDKVRAGYILQERCQLLHPIIDKWAKHIQRGGSRKLYAHNPYSPNFSERWSLSINIEE